MKRLLCWLAALPLVLAAQDALAFDACNVASDPAHLGQELRDIATERSPVRYHELARSIRLITADTGDRLMPGGGEQQDIKFILFPASFVKATCEIALGTYMNIEGVEPDAFDQAARTAAQCRDAGGTQKACLIGFADELDRRYGKAFAALPAGQSQVAIGLYQATLHQIMMHEYAHHFLGHLDRIAKQQISRIDAEFEADLFAITNGVQGGEPVSAMYYLFSGLSDIENYSKKSTTEDYESAACRSKNVENIVAYLKIAPLMLVDAAMGGHAYLSRSSPSLVRADLDKQFADPPPGLKPGSCGRIAERTLFDTREELKQLYARMGTDLDFLFDTGQNLDVERANRLLHDLSEMSQNLRYMDGIAAKCVALMLRGWGIKGRNLTPLVDEVDRLLDKQAVTQHFLSEDFGRLLQAQGLAMLQERVDMAPQARLDRSFSALKRAVNYNPAQTEAWMNLAMIAFKRGDCASASRFAEYSVLTNTEKAERKGAQFFATKMKEFSSDPEACRVAGAGFHPYQGL